MLVCLATSNFVYFNVYNALKQQLQVNICIDATNGCLHSRRPMLND